MDTPAHLNMLDALFDEYSCQLLKCINVLSFDYPQDHMIVRYAYSVLKENGFRPPDDSLSNRRAFGRSLLMRLDTHLLHHKAQRRESLQKLSCNDPSFFYYHQVYDLAEDIDNPISHDNQLQEYPFTPRQKEVLEHIADVTANKELADDDPIVTTAIAKLYFEFRKAMPFLVDIPTEREKLIFFVSQVLPTK